ncbi:uncharacterized protein LOC105226812 isoform X4 [Bactrocera dorsalis]|uniref:Uncharacterized protein LOC105226812 isoform X3 n=1 Tax=Bactrocera dorsalis TaxID=27457 RepID=A0ABM3KAC4_BACDO|nr:uncharacterized protein LOC105226812 isoform X3 [Bactrocera dorsalis]XP_049318425.1 uncharacterized protein LOC105226812 isoform X4 [Bactrocera dorsalis]
MNESLKLFEEIVGSQFHNLFVDSLEEYSDIDLKVALEKVVCSSMRNSGNYSLVLRLLNGTYNERTNKKTCLWTSIILKLYVSCKESRDATQLLAILGVLAKSAYTSEESRKIFGCNYVKNILEIISKNCYTPSNNLAALRLMVILLQFYPEYSVQSSGIVKDFVSQFMDSPNHNVMESAAKCYHHLLSISKNGSSRIAVKDLWKAYQGGLLDMLQTLSDSFVGVLNAPVIEPINCEPLNIPILQLCDDPIKRISQVFIRFKNVAVYFIVTLREPFLSEKPVNTNKIFGIIKGALNVVHLFTNRKKTIIGMMRNLLLPEFYFILLQILKALMITLKSDLRKNYKQIWMILGDMLKLSTHKIVIEQKKTYMRLNGKIYDVITLWCKIVNQGSRSDLLIDLMLKDMQDISSTLSKILNSKICSSGTDLETIVQELICSKQKCIFEVLNSSPNNVNYDITKTIVANVLTAFSGMYDLSLNKYNYECRTDFVSNLFSMFTANIYLDPSTAEIFVNTLRHIPLTDQRIEDHTRYALMMLHLESCIHPQKNNLKSSIEIDLGIGFPMLEDISIKSNYEDINKMNVKSTRDITQPAKNYRSVGSFQTVLKQHHRKLVASAEFYRADSPWPDKNPCMFRLSRLDCRGNSTIRSNE